MVRMNKRPYLSLGITAGCTLANSSKATQSLRGTPQVLHSAMVAPSSEPSHLDNDFLHNEESSILGSFHDRSHSSLSSLIDANSEAFTHTSSWHRSLQSNNCMDDLYTSQSLNCNGDDVELLAIMGITVENNPSAYLDTDGLWKDACSSYGDQVTISFAADIHVRPPRERYDIGMYINTEGGSPLTGTCAMSLISETDFFGGAAAESYTDTNGDVVEIGEFGTGEEDECPDVLGTGILTNYSFAPVSRLRIALCHLLLCLGTRSAHNPCQLHSR